MSHSFCLVSAAYLFSRKSKRILLLQRGPNKNYRASVWSGVGGKIEWGEMALQCAVREISEETGIHVRPKELKFLGYSEILNEGMHALVLCFGAQVEEQPVRLTPEHTAFDWFDLDDLPKNRTREDFRALRERFFSHSRARQRGASEEH